MKYRSSHEIIADVLQACRESPASKTTIWQVAKYQVKYVDLLLSRGLLRETAAGFEITGRGREFLAAVEYAEGMLVEVPR